MTGGVARSTIAQEKKISCRRPTSGWKGRLCNVHYSKADIRGLLNDVDSTPP